jgi:hypothetical protein
VRVIRGWCSSDSARTGPAPGQFSRPGRWRFRAADDVHGICSSPFAVLLRPRSRVSAPSSRRARAHLPFRLVSRREFHRSRDPVFAPVQGDVGRGSWVLAPRASLRHVAVAPAIAFARRGEAAGGSGLPWVSLAPAGKSSSTRVGPCYSAGVPVDMNLNPTRPIDNPVFPVKSIRKLGEMAKFLIVRS